MRDKLLEEKAQDIKKDLEEWAKRVGILNSGEHLVFSLHIDTQPTVVQEGSTFLDKSVADFFNRERFQDAGVANQLATLTSNAILNGSEAKKGSGQAYVSVREFLERYPNKRRLMKIKNFGEKSLSCVVQILDKFGVQIPN